MAVKLVVQPSPVAGVELQLLQLQHGGDTVLVNLHGATLTSWVHGGEELIFVSSRAVLDNKKAIRGGIPLVFPKFGPWAAGPNHGFARVCTWVVGQHGSDADGVFAELALSDTEATRALWPHAFTLVFSVHLAAGKLTTSLSVTNNTDAPFSFEALLHTYIRVPDLAHVTVSGLKGKTYMDKVRGGARDTEARDLVRFEEQIDRVYEAALDAHTVTHVGASRVRKAGDHSSTLVATDIVLSKANLPDTVVWNPWIERARELGDLAPEEYERFVCVEAGVVAAPVVLAGGATWQGAQTLVATKHT